MKAVLVALVFLISGSAQEPLAKSTATFPLTTVFYTEMEPSSVVRGLFGSSSSRAQEGNDTIIRTWAFSADRRVFWGCEIVIEHSEGDQVYLAHFRPLTLTGIDITANTRHPNLGDPAQWVLEPPPEYAAPQRVEAGQTLVFDLMVNRLTGERITGYLEFGKAPEPLDRTLEKIQKMSDSQLRDFKGQITQRLQAVDNTITDLRQKQFPLRPRVEKESAPAPLATGGLPRDFTVEDAEMQISSPRVHIDGVLQSLSFAASAKGSVIWLYVPGRGRFIVSLASHPGFSATGIVQGDLLELKDGQDSIVVESVNPVVSEFGTYVVSVRIEKEWRPNPSEESSLHLGSLNATDLVSTTIR